MSLTRLLHEIGACRICEANLPHGPRPILRLSSAARLLIISQAPGSKVHQTRDPVERRERRSSARLDEFGPFDFLR